MKFSEYKEEVNKLEVVDQVKEAIMDDDKSTNILEIKTYDALTTVTSKFFIEPPRWCPRSLSFAVNGHCMF